MGAGAPGIQGLGGNISRWLQAWLPRERTEMDQIRLLTSMVLERKSGKRQGWSARGCPQAQHPPEG